MTKETGFQAIREAVIEALRQGECLFEALPDGIYSQQVRCKVSYQGDRSPAVPATLGREAMYVVARAIHPFVVTLRPLLGMNHHRFHFGHFLHRILGTFSSQSTGL